MARTTFSDAAVTVSVTLRSLIADTTSGLPTQTADGDLLGAIVRCSTAAAGDTFVVQVIGASGELLWEESRTGPWPGPIVIPAMTLPAGGWDIVASKGAGTDRSLGIEGAYETGDETVLRRATAQAGTATTITLDASASATNDLYNGCLVALVSGTGAGQTRRILDYVGSTKVATVDTWITNPDSTSVFLILPGAMLATDEIGSAQLAASAVTGIAAGITVPTAEAIADAVLDESLLDHLTLDTVGGALAAAVGLAQGNQMIDNITHASGKMTECRLRLFDTNASLAAATPDTGGGYESGEIARYEMTATYSGDNLASYEVVRVDPT